MLFVIRRGLASSLRKLVNSIRGREILKIIFDSTSLESLVKILNFAATAPMTTTTARMKICVMTISVCMSEKRHKGNVFQQ